jgi:hypothetical protein
MKPPRSFYQDRLVTNVRNKQTHQGIPNRPLLYADAELGDLCSDNHISMDYVLMSPETTDLFTSSQV